MVRARVLLSDYARPPSRTYGVQGTLAVDALVVVPVEIRPDPGRTGDTTALSVLDPDPLAWCHQLFSVRHRVVRTAHRVPPNGVVITNVKCQTPGGWNRRSGHRAGTVTVTVGMSVINVRSVGASGPPRAM